MATFNKFNAFIENVMNAKMNLATDALKVMLTNSAPVATNSLFGDLTEIAAGNGYSAGGAAITTTSSTQSSGTYKLILQNVTITASGGTIGPFRYVVVYDSTPTSPLKPLIGYYDYGSNVTLNAGDTFTTNFDAVNGCISAS
jgi:hypothetical protein